jgi:hypothetical protein
MGGRLRGRPLQTNAPKSDRILPLWGLKSSGFGAPWIRTGPRRAGSAACSDPTEPCLPSILRVACGERRGGDPLPHVADASARTLPLRRPTPPSRHPECSIPCCFGDRISPSSARRTPCDGARRDPASTPRASRRRCSASSPRSPGCASTGRDVSWMLDDRQHITGEQNGESCDCQVKAAVS